MFFVFFLTANKYRSQISVLSVNPVKSRQEVNIMVGGRAQYYVKRDRYFLVY